MKMFVVAALAAISVAAPAVAQSAPVRVGVSAAGLDLSTPLGQARLDRRILRAAVAACGPVSAADLEGGFAARRCATDTVAEARPRRDRLVALATRAEVAGR